MFGEVAQQAIHLREVRAIDQISTLLLKGDKAGMRQLLQVEGQRVARDAELIGHDAGHETAEAGNHEGAKHAQTLGMGQGAEGENSLRFMHCSIIQRLLNY
ncbi:hypothetical protein AXY46_12065 [Achromobacter xylosoxidans]|nr:hypothetical protein AXY46_12065 [Achromobacter xylosoxidans]